MTADSAGAVRHDDACSRCGALGARYSSSADSELLVCASCFVRGAPLLRRAALTALVVGTILTAINQSDVLAREGLTLRTAWRSGLTYLVPFCVTIWGAISFSRRRPR